MLSNCASILREGRGREEETGRERERGRRREGEKEGGGEREEGERESLFVILLILFTNFDSNEVLTCAFGLFSHAKAFVEHLMIGHGSDLYPILLNLSHFIFCFTLLFCLSLSLVFLNHFLLL